MLTIENLHSIALVRLTRSGCAFARTSNSDLKKDSKRAVSCRKRIRPGPGFSTKHEKAQ